MASNRHLGRIVALQTLYEREFRLSAEDKTFDLDSVLQRNIGRYSEAIEDVDFINALVRGIAEKEAELDGIIQPLAPEWPILQVPAIDRIVLRMGLFELYHMEDVPPKVAINEAVELAKAFGSESSSRFVNGVLGSAFRQKNGEPPKKPKRKKSE